MIHGGQKDLQSLVTDRTGSQATAGHLLHDAGRDTRHEIDDIGIRGADQTDGIESALFHRLIDAAADAVVADNHDSGPAVLASHAAHCCTPDSLLLAQSSGQGRDQ